MVNCYLSCDYKSGDIFGLIILALLSLLYENRNESRCLIGPGPETDQVKCFLILDIFMVRSDSKLGCHSSPQ